MPREHELDMLDGYALWASSYDRERNGLIEAEELRLTALASGIGLVRSALDVATGTGRFALRWARAGAAVVALDQSPEMLAMAREKTDAEGLTITFVQQPMAARLPFPAGHFDLVSCGLALCHVPDLVEVVREMGRVLRTGGHLLITDFHPEAVLRGWRTVFAQGDEVNYLPNVAHTRQQYLDAVCEAGCGVIHVDDLLLRDAPPDSFPAGVDVERLLREDGDKTFGLIVLGRKMSSC